MQMDVRDMSLFPDESFDSVIDKGLDLSLHKLRSQYLQYVELTVCFMSWYCFAVVTVFVLHWSSI
jgi:hypothetical protein